MLTRDRSWQDDVLELVAEEEDDEEANETPEVGVEIAETDTIMEKEVNPAGAVSCESEWEGIRPPIYECVWNNVQVEMS